MDPQDALRKYHLLHYQTQWYSPHSYSIDEVANLLAVKPEAILSFIAANDLPAEPVGKSYRVDVNDLEEFLLTRSEGMPISRTLTFTKT